MNVWVICRLHGNDDWPFAVYAKKSAAVKRVKELVAEEGHTYRYHIDMVAFHE